MEGRMYVIDAGFVENCFKYLSLSFDEQEFKAKLQEIKEKSPTKEERLRTLVDRIEFIFHLKVLREHAHENKFVLAGQEVRGVDFDINALRLYLALTCVDIFSRFVPFGDWLVHNCNDKTKKESIDEFIRRKRDEYTEELGTTSSFIKAFSESSNRTRKSLESNLMVETITGTKTNNIVEIARYLIKIRNKYTHEGRRFHLGSSVPFTQVQLLGPRDEKCLHIKSGFDLVAAILEVAIARARKVLKLGEMS